MSQSNQENDDSINFVLNEDTPLLSSNHSSSSLSLADYHHRRNHHQQQQQQEEDQINDNSTIRGATNHFNNSVQLDTLADSIHFIIKRDSEISLFRQQSQNSNEASSSPWLLDSVVGSPMLTSPHFQNFLFIPDLEKRRQRQIQKHEYEIKLLKQQQQQQVSASSDNLLSRSENYNNNNNSNDIALLDSHMYTSKIENEDEQWERKRIAKLQKVISSSSMSIASSSSSKKHFDCKYSPTHDILRDLQQEFSKTKTPTLVAILYGIINTVIVLPVLMSFGSIIYHDEFFRPYLPVLIKLTVVSGVVHQLSFSIFSTLPFAVGQVQDAGLIFLSTMASSIVRYCHNEGRTDEEILATTLIGLSMFTTILGVGLVVIGRLKLAGYVQLLPTPVVGGYLAFIGFFCGQGGLCLMSQVQVSGILEWYKFGHEKALILSLPGIIGGISIYISIRSIKHMAVLPCVVASIIIVFYVALGMNGLSLEDAKYLGWVNEGDTPPVWYKTWEFMKFDKVVWNALPGQSLTVLSMIIVVALSSSLDIAAIDLEITKPLEYNYELRMIGLSNIFSGLTGGYTGSYIFSQSIFSLRAGIRSRVMGFIIALCEAITVVIPFTILSYVPNFVFGSLLIMICVDLMVEWLWEVRIKLSGPEYFIALATFALIQVTTVEYGIILGSILHYLLLKLNFDVGTSRKAAMEDNLFETTKKDIKGAKCLSSQFEQIDPRDSSPIIV